MEVRNDRMQEARLPSCPAACCDECAGFSPLCMPRHTQRVWKDRASITSDIRDGQALGIRAWQVPFPCPRRSPASPLVCCNLDRGHITVGCKPSGALCRLNPAPFSRPLFGMGSVDGVLSELHAGGFTALAGEVPGLRPQKVISFMCWHHSLESSHLPWLAAIDTHRKGNRSTRKGPRRWWSFPCAVLKQSRSCLCQRRVVVDVRLGGGGFTPRPCLCPKGTVQHAQVSSTRALSSLHASQARPLTPSPLPRVLPSSACRRMSPPQACSTSSAATLACPPARSPPPSQTRWWCPLRCRRRRGLCTWR